MNEFYKGVITSLFTKALTGVSVWLVANGWLSHEQTTQIVLGLSGLAASVIWTFYSRYKDTLLKNAALQLTDPNATMNDAKKLAASDAVAPATQPPTVAPPAVSTSAVRNLSVLLCAGLVSMSSFACVKANPNASPERKVALYGIQAGKYLGEVKTSADELYTKKVLPEAAYRHVLKALVKANAAGEQLGAALKAYDAAITDAERNSIVAQIDAALLALQAALPTIVPEGLPLDVAQRISKGVAEVQRLMLTIARFTAPEGAYMRSVAPGEWTITHRIAA